MERPYCLKKRKPQNIWYYRLKGEQSYHSTGLKVKAKAEEYVQNILYGGTGFSKTITLKAFSKDLFIFGNCPLLRRMERKGKNITKYMAQLRRGHVQNHIIPIFGKRQINHITALEIDDWLIDLKLANETKNHMLGTLRIIFDEAMLKGIVEKNPARQIRQFPSKSNKRDILTPKEIHRLFPTDKAELLRIWGDLKWATMFYVMLTTGIRLGEVKALTWGDWYREFNVFQIDKAVKNDETIGTTKNGKERIVLILDTALNLLKEWESEALFTDDDDLIFCCNRKKPINRKTCSEHFKKGLKHAHIEVGERNIVIHSLRHTMNTNIRRSFDDETLRLFTGHLDSKMTDNYDHPTVEDDIQKVIPFRKKMEEAWSKNLSGKEHSV